MWYRKKLMKKVKKIYISYIKWAFSIFVCSWVFYYLFNNVDFEHVYKILIKTDLNLILYSLFIGYLLYLVPGLELKLSLNKLCSINLKLIDVLLFPISCSIFGYIFPFKGGLVFQALVLKNKYNVGYTNNISIFIISYLFIFIFSGIFFIIFFMISNQPIFYFPSFSILYILSMFMIYKVLYSDFFLFKNSTNFFIVSINKIFVELREISTDIDLMFKLFFLSMIRLFLRIFWYYIILSSLDFNSAIFISFLLSLFYECSSLLKIIPGNLGVNEFVTSSLLLYFGSTIDIGFYTESIVRLTGLSLIFTLGFVGLFFNRRFLFNRNG